MTSMAELERWLAELEAAHAATSRAAGDRYGMALYRLHLGCPNDADLNEIIAHGGDVMIMSAGISDTIDRADDRDRQLHERTAFRLAADVSLAQDHDEIREALAALRQLATSGRYETTKGRQRADPDQVGLARLLLRLLVQGIRRERDGGWDSSVAHNTD